MSAVFVLPMIFMFLATMTGLVLILVAEVGKGQVVLPVMAVLLTLLGAGFAIRVFKPSGSHT